MQIGEKTNKKLDLVKINSAQKQVVAGLNYVLVIETAAESEKETYEAKVYGRGHQHAELCCSMRVRVHVSLHSGGGMNLNSTSNACHLSEHVYVSLSCRALGKPALEVDKPQEG